MPEKVIELQHIKVQPPYIQTDVLVYQVDLQPAVCFALMGHN